MIEFMDDHIKAEHAHHVSNRFRERMFKKYRQGQEEHGGDLSRKAVQGHIMEEAIDQAVYLETHMDHLDEIDRYLQRALESLDKCHCDGQEFRGAYEAIIKAHNILTIGNPEGIEEEERE